MAFFGISALAYGVVSGVISIVRQQKNLSERLTEKASRAVEFAQHETKRTGQSSVGSEMFLIGLLQEGTGIAAHILNAAGLDVERVRIESARVVGAVDAQTNVFTLTEEEIVEQAWKESRSLGHAYIGTEHLLLALVEAADGAACQVLDNLKIDRSSLRTKVLEMVS